jgi:polar amino acid transport system substrate-binding protein
MGNRTKAPVFVFAAFFLLLVLCSTISCQQDSNALRQSKETVYDRVMRTGTLRAAYISYPPALMKDTATGKITGIFAEALERAAENMGLKVQWTEEVGWGAQIEGLQADRYDIIGSPVWANPTRGKLTTLSIPLYYSGIGAWVRSDDNRFDHDLGAINTEAVQIATIDGETGDLIARTQFSRAKRHSLPQLTDISQLFLEVTNKKADLLFAEPYFAYKFLEANPKSVKNVAAERPVKVLGNCYMMKLNEPLLKHALDISLQDLLGSGYVDELLNKYEPFPNTFYRVAEPYKLVK